jgi:hypothetical protein
LLSTQQQLEATNSLFQQTRDHLARIQIENKNYEIEIQSLQKISTLPSNSYPISPQSSALLPPAPLQTSEEKIEIERLEGRIKYYQEQLDEQRNQCSVMNENLLRSHAELMEHKQQLRTKDRELIEEQSQNKELKRAMEEMKKRSDQQTRQEQIESQGRRKVSQTTSSPPLSLDDVEVVERRSTRGEVGVRGGGVGARHGSGYFDESESTIAVDDIGPFSQNRPHGGQIREGGRGERGKAGDHQLTQHERSAAEMIASIFIEEMQPHCSLPGKKISESVLYEVSVKVALRLLCDARKVRDGIAGSSLLELLNDRRFLADLVADTQVTATSSLLYLRR